MTINPATLTKLETLPASLQSKPVEDGARVVILLKLRAGAPCPAYVDVRTRISAQIVTAELSGADLARLGAEASVESFSLSRALPVLD